jgi:hypothetical protein
MFCIVLEVPKATELRKMVQFENVSDYTYSANISSISV